MSTGDPITQLKDDALALVAKDGQDAINAAIAALQAIETDTTAAVPTLSTDTVNVLIEFVPEAFRPIVLPFLQGAAGTLDPVAIAAIQKGLSWAIARLQALKL